MSGDALELLDEPMYLVSETADGPTMPHPAFAALALVRAQTEVTAALDSLGVPQDHHLRFKAARMVAELVARVLAKDLEQIKLEHGREQWRARKRR